MRRVRASGLKLAVALPAEDVDADVDVDADAELFIPQEFPFFSR